MNFSIYQVLELLLVLARLNSLLGEVVSQRPKGPAAAGPEKKSFKRTPTSKPIFTFIPFSSLVDPSHDTSEFWRATEILSLIQARRGELEGLCAQEQPTSQDAEPELHLPSQRTVRPICRGALDYQVCPQCPHFSNRSECELFRDSCRERRVLPEERETYCDRKYGKWRATLIPADYEQCRCCDDCVFFRELDQSCALDDYAFDIEEILPVTTIDFRAGCNPYWGHPEQESKALRCDRILERCVLASSPALAVKESVPSEHSFRFESRAADMDCPVSCRGYTCREGAVQESKCKPGAFLPLKDTCNCCGHCSKYQQLNEKCANFKTTVHDNNGTKDVEVEEERLEPGCDEGLVCRQGTCQDIHAVPIAAAATGDGTRRDGGDWEANEPCKREMKLFKKKYGAEGHLHYDAPQCSPLWLYAPVQCRRFVCYCAMEDGTFIQGIKVPRVEVSNMNCDCAREKCRTGTDLECDGYGNYKEAIFTPHTSHPGASVKLNRKSPNAVP